MAIDKSDSGFFKQVCLCHHFCKIKNIFHTHTHKISNITICMKGDYGDKKHVSITAFELEILTLKLVCFNSLPY